MSSMKIRPIEGRPYRDILIEKVRGCTPELFANSAGCVCPRHIEGPEGYEFWSRVKDAAVEWVEGAHRDLDRPEDARYALDRDEDLEQMTSRVVDLVLYTMWQQFVQIHAYLVEVDDFGQMGHEEYARTALSEAARTGARSVIEQCISDAKDQCDADWEDYWARCDAENENENENENEEK